MTQSSFRLGWPLVALTVASLVGCADEPPRGEPVYEVTGQVNFKGKPISKGIIQFTSPEDVHRGSDSSARIVDGEFSALVTEGVKQVKIWEPQTFGQVDATGAQPQREMLPPAYNVRSKLEANIPAGGTTVDFDLK